MFKLVLLLVDVEPLIWDQLSKGGSAPYQHGPFHGDAEYGGKPYFPSQIKGDYNPDVKGDKGAGLKGPPVDGDYTNFMNGSGGGKEDGKDRGWWGR